MKKVLTVGKKILLIILCIIGAFLIYKGFICGHTMPILKEDGIAEYNTVVLGGIKQDILIRGENIHNPVLLYLHGGPGNPESSFIVPYQRELEKHFIVVNWDQRGSGRSYDASLTQQDISTDAICQDTIELTNYLEERFGVEKIYLAGHSYGAYVGMRCAGASPEDYYAYIGMGQVGNQQDNEKYLQAFARKEAEADGNEQALNELAQLEEGSYSKENFGKELSIVRKWCTYYGGSVYQAKNADMFTRKAIWGLEYNIKDLLGFVKGSKLYYQNNGNDLARWELYHANLKEEVPKVLIPIYFIQGEHDYCVTFQSCQEYFDVLDAPKKHLYAIKDCAHNPLYEKSDEVSKIMIDILNE